MKNKFFPVLVMALFTASSGFAKCKIKPENIEKVAASIKWQNENGEPENTAVIAANLSMDQEAEDDSEGKSVTITEYEAFVRPDKNEAFQVLPIPLFLVEMSKERDSIYICSHMDSSDPKKNLTVVYFLRYNRISPVTPMPLPIRQLGKLIWGPIENTPLIVTKIPLSALARIQTLIMHAFSDLTRIGVDRVRITETKIELFSGGNTARFDNHVLYKAIPLE